MRPLTGENDLKRRRPGCLALSNQNQAHLLNQFDYVKMGYTKFYTRVNLIPSNNSITLKNTKLYKWIMLFASGIFFIIAITLLCWQAVSASCLKKGSPNAKHVVLL